jgi:hypothetical protein
MTDATAPGLDRSLTVTEAALIDAQRGQQAMARRRQQMSGGDPAVPLTESDRQRSDPWDAATLDALTRPVRLEIAFTDPIKVRAQIDAITECLREARQATYDHDGGIARQLLRLHSIVKQGANVLVYLNGKAPSGKRKPGAR